MVFDKHFEATGNVDDWPANVPGKPTQAAVYGVRGASYEILWTGRFPDLDPALYWAAKKEMEAVRKGKWPMASRVVWQHELTPEQAVAVIHRQMSPQIERVLGQADRGEDIDVGTGPMREVKPGEAEKYYVELEAPDGESQGFVVEPDQLFEEMLDRMDDPDDPFGGYIREMIQDEQKGGWIPDDPRDS